MKRKLDCYLRSHRRRSGLTQREVAFLLGIKSETCVSRWERCERVPNLKTAFAFKIIFGTPVPEFFPRLFTLVEEEVVRRAYELLQRLEESKGKAALAKRNHLRAMLARAVDRQSNPGL